MTNYNQHIMNKLIGLPLLLSATFIFAQNAPSSSEAVLNALHQKEQLANSSIVKNIPFTNVGPTVMSGRVVDVDVNPQNPTEFYVGYASGGVWYTKNNGTTFTPILDNAQTQNVGDIAVDWKNGIIWVGTGENNASRSSYAGIGILKSSDHGETWKNVGLLDAQHIGRILIDPNNSNTIIVGATGHLYSDNEERGIYKTTDGGTSWKKTLYINSSTGIIDVAFAPDNFNTMYAAAWEKGRKAWDFIGNGNGSGIYKSTDAGTTWTKISTPESGFPTGEGVGRIGLAVFDEHTVYAVHDNQFRRKKTTSTATSKGLTKDDFKSMTADDLLKIEDKKLNEFLKTNGFQEKYRAANVKQLVRSGSVKPIDLAKYLEDANAMLFDTPVIGAEVYKSTDGGTTWSKQNENYIDDLFYSYGYYFAQINVDPSNVDKIYLAGVPIIKSDDGGKTYTSINGENVHADHHALWINPKMSGHLINGNDGGINISYDDGANWIKSNTPAVGQFYAVNVDNEKPYNIYGGLQDNGVWKGVHTAKEDVSWHQSGDYPWKSILGGDGMQVQIDNRNSNIVYTGFQFGNYFRLDLENKKRDYIQPKHELGETPYRFNWQTPILLSPHNQDILYLGGNKLHRSLNQGTDWETISEDLTNGGKEGNVAYGTITSISESPFKFGLLYTGSDDGMIFMTQNGGGSWDNIANSLPKNLWVTRVVASKHKKERIYATLNGYRNDDFESYIYTSDDFGKTWQDIANNIPSSPVNILTEDPENENLLFTGTDNGLYVSFNRGASWEVFQNDMPNVAVHDIVIQPEAKHLIIGTHGRSIYKADISNLQRMTPEILDKNIHVFTPETIKHSARWGSSWSTWGTPQTPGLDLYFYTKNEGVLEATILTNNGIEISSTTLENIKGFNLLSYDLAFSKSGKSAYLKKVKTELIEANDGKTYLPKGNYTIKLTGKGIKETIAFEIE